MGRTKAVASRKTRPNRGQQQSVTSPLLLVIFFFLATLVSTPRHRVSAQSTTSLIDPTLPFGDVNVLILTDVHSWVGGHGGHEPEQNADYGDILSFYQRLKAHCNDHKMDLWLVVNGDWIDGTGISLNGDTSFLTPLLEKLPFDALNIGNHELYRDRVLHEIMRPGGFVEWWGDRYLSSNIVVTNPAASTTKQPNEPIGRRYRLLKGHNSTVLTFGFLYNMEDASTVVTVEHVEHVVEQDWFTKAVKAADPLDQYDAILVLAHMGCKDHLVSVILNKIRALVGPTVPVQIVTGHTHKRDVDRLDRHGVSFEAGRYLDTLGFVSFPKQSTILRRTLQQQTSLKQTSGQMVRLLPQNQTEDPVIPLVALQGTEGLNVSTQSANNQTGAPEKSTHAPTTTASTTTATTAAPLAQATKAPSTEPLAAPLFEHQFLDANLQTLAKSLGLKDPKELPTEDGAQLSEFIFRTRSGLGLLELVGCAPQSYYLNRSVGESDSLWGLFIDKVAPSELVKPTKEKPHKLFVGGSGGLRYDLLGRRLIVDDIIAASPFNESVLDMQLQRQTVNQTVVTTGFPGSILKRMLEEVWNTKPSTEHPKLPNFVVAPPERTIQSDIVYQVLTPEWSVNQFQDAIKKLNLTDIVIAVPTNYYTTSEWINFVRETWECSNKDVNEHKINGEESKHNSNQHSGSTSSDGNDHTNWNYPIDDTATDTMRLILAAVALSSVMVLGIVYVWQLHKQWLVRYNERQQLIFISDQENELI